MEVIAVFIVGGFYLIFSAYLELVKSARLEKERVGREKERYLYRYYGLMSSRWK